MPARPHACAAGLVAVVCIGLALGGCGGDESGKPAASVAWEYPPMPRGDVVDDYHGVPVADPYRAFEHLDAPATAQWIEAENALTLPYLASLPSHGYFRKRVGALLDYERYGVPQVAGGAYVFSYNAGTDEQDSIRVTSDPSERGRLLIDPATLSADGTVSVSSFYLSGDGRWLAYAVSDGGSDWRTLRVLEVASGNVMDDALSGIKFTGVAWAPDDTGFFYSRYPRSAAAEGYDDQQQVSIWYHTLGSPQSDDREVYRVPDHPTRNPYATVSDDGQYLVIGLYDGYKANGWYYKTLDGNDWSADTERLLDAWDARYEFLGNRGRTFFFQTVRDAPRGRIVAIDLDNPGPMDWRTPVPESENAIRTTTIVGGRFIVQYLVDAHARVRTFDLDGTPRDDVSLPGLGSVTGFAGRMDDDEAWFSYTDFMTPRSVYRFVPASGEVDTVHTPQTDIDPTQYVTRQVFVEANGVRVPMFIVRRKDVDPDEPQPTVLYGYGGFNVPVLPAYSSVRMAWIDAGGVYASANIRGGGEYGEAWYRAGTVLNKQHVFDDFIASAEWLIDNGVTDPDHLAIWGGSNGGLLVAAVEVQRPELFAAVVPAVGVLDMLRYQTASANARQWSTDYGLSENSDEFRAQYAYSPYHNLRPDTCYPPTLVVADTNDDRVLPWHSYKFAAELQYVQRCNQPALIRIETRSGHGAGRSTSKTVEQYADQWAFVAEFTGLQPRGTTGAEAR